MPIYEYQCYRCGKEFQSIVLNKIEEEGIYCPECGGNNLKKLISQSIYHISEKDRLIAFDPSDTKDDSIYKDTRNIGLSAKKRAQQMDVNLGKGFEEKLEKLRTDPSSVFKDI